MEDAAEPLIDTVFKQKTLLMQLLIPSPKTPTWTPAGPRSFALQQQPVKIKPRKWTMANDDPDDPSHSWLHDAEDDSSSLITTVT